MARTRVLWTVGWATVFGVMILLQAGAPPCAAGESATGEAAAEAGPEETQPDDGSRYPVSRFVLHYESEHPGHPALSNLQNLGVALGRVEDGFVAPRPGLPVQTWQLSRSADGEVFFYASAIRHMAAAVVDALGRHGLVGVYVQAAADDVDPKTGEDLRAEGDTQLDLVVYTTVVKEVRTVASGERVPSEQRVNHPAHRRIRECSPVQPSDETGQRRDLLNKDVLDDYVFRLNRHPGRRVDVAVSSAGAEGAAVLDYLVAESRPWLTYFQFANTGTEETEEWRERFGFVHNQLTGEDDILSLDYVTGGFDEANAFVASYRRPLRWQEFDLRLYGSWSEFDASDVGFAGQDFSGETWYAGAEVIWTIYQRGQLFLDLIGGARWQNVEVDNELTGVTGDEDLFLPYVGLQLERKNRRANTRAYVDIEHNFSGLPDTDHGGVEDLGRMDVESEWTVVHWDISHSFFLEPVLCPESWDDLSGSETPTLAHELAFALKGQHALGNRLIPQMEATAGGTYTVRGYPESAAAGDNVYVFRAEYRYHVPRALEPRPDPPEVPLLGRPFRFAPQQPFGQPDWDLILKVFFDAGHTDVADRQAALSEYNETLRSCGLGVELQVLRNLNVRCDWGHTLADLDNGEADENEDRLHVGVTLVW